MTGRNLNTSRQQVFGSVQRGTECRICGRDVTDGRSVYCSQYCSDIADAVMQLLNWAPVRRRIIDRDDETCQECGLKRTWIRTGGDHIRDIVESELPERPPGPDLVDSDEWTDEDWSEHFDRLEEWNERRNELKDRYGDPYDRDPDHRLEVDHVTPVADGGHPFDPANLRTLCAACHREKTARENSERAAEPAERPERSLTEFIADNV